MADNISITKGDLPFNAEVFIDWSDKQVQFTYPYPLPYDDPIAMQRLKDKAYFAHVLVQMAALAGVVVVAFFARGLISPENFTSLAAVLDIPIPSLAIAVLLSFYAVAGVWYFAFLYLFGTISIVLHRNSKLLRDRFPETNAAIKKLFRHKIEIDLMKQGGKDWFKTSGWILIPRMNTLDCELEIPDEASQYISTIQSVCVDSKPNMFSRHFWLLIGLTEVGRLPAKIIVYN